MATVGPTVLPAFFNTDADFRTWGSTVSAALATLGLVQTGDTGQINWTTVTKPASTNAAQGYEIWRFADTLQATTPIFLKVEYGSGGSVDRPNIWITVGSASNGSGTLTGQVSTRTQVGANVSKAAGVTLPFYASGNSGELILIWNVDTASNSFGCLICVERPKDSTDATTSEGCLVSDSSSFAAHSQYVPASGSVPGQATSWWGLWPGAWGRSGSGASADAAPIFIPLGGVWRYSHLMSTGAGDFTSGGTMSCSIFGGTHTYLALDRSCSGNQTAISTGSSGLFAGTAVRFE